MITSPPSPAFELNVLTITLERLLPSRTFPEKLRLSVKYRSLLASIKEVGIIEPLNVFPQKGGMYLVLDGHARLEALRDAGFSEAPCLIAKEEEAYTYNQKVNRISQIQANRMIIKALNAGLPEERVAKALNLAVHTIKSSRSLLKDICPEAVALLQDKPVSRKTLMLLKKVKPIRQIEMAEIMITAGTYSGTYARALLMTTPKSQLIDPGGTRQVPGIQPEDLARIEHEMKVQEQDFRLLDETYNENVMALTIARGYFRSLMDNGRIVHFLSQHCREYLPEFQRILEAESLE